MQTLDIVTLTVGQLQTNCYLVIDGTTSDALIIDPGDDADYIERIISDKRLNPKSIIATHGHFDHILAVTELTLAYKIPFLIHRGDEFLVSNMQNSAKHFEGIDVDPPPRIDKFIDELNLITVGSHSLRVFHTPGHTPGSLSIYCKKECILFCGDLLFAGGAVGRTDFSYSDPKLLAQSLSKVLLLSQDTIVYPGHGDRTKIGIERSIYN